VTGLSRDVHDHSPGSPLWVQTLGGSALVGFRSGGAGSRDQARNKGAEQGPSASARVVNELEEAEIEWQLVLRDAPVWTEPGALHPIRLKNFADLQLGISLVQIEDGWWIVLGPTDTVILSR
jgi:hypothetical protein